MSTINGRYADMMTTLAETTDPGRRSIIKSRLGRIIDRAEHADLTEWLHLAANELLFARDHVERDDTLHIIDRLLDRMNSLEPLCVTPASSR